MTLPTTDPSQRMLFDRKLPGQLSQAAGAQSGWLWHGYLIAGNITLFTSQWKAGKTTLLANLLARMAHGGSLAGRSVAAGKAAVITEEAAGNWHNRCQKLGIGDHVSFYCRPFR